MMEEKLLSHRHPKAAFGDFPKHVENIRHRLLNTPNLMLPLEETLFLLDQLTEFELGRFLLKNSGVNGYWTSYILMHQPNKTIAHPLESWILTQSLWVLARERFHVFKREIQNRLQPNMHLASIPCGLMDDLLTLDYDLIENIRLTGIDLDIQSIDLAKQNAIKNNLEVITNFIKQDAWSLNLENQFDLITSNGLNMYESQNDRLIDLYSKFYSALKPEGTLLVSFLPPPPNGNLREISSNLEISEENLKKELAVFKDIIQANYFNFSTEEEIRHQVKTAGFTVESVVYTKGKTAPILIAKKLGQKL